MKKLKQASKIKLNVGLCSYFLLITTPQLYPLFFIGSTVSFHDGTSIYSFLFSLLIILLRATLLSLVFKHSLTVMSVTKRILIYFISLITIIELINALIWLISGFNFRNYHLFAAVINSTPLFIYIITVSIFLSHLLNKDCHVRK